MPTYDLRNIKTGEVIQKLCSISAKEELVEQGEWVQVHLGTPMQVTHVGSMLSKTSGDWRDRLKQIKQHSGGNYNDKLGHEKTSKYGLANNSIHD